MRRFMLLSVALILFGCATAGTDFDLKAFDQITNGMTRVEVVKVIGQKPTHEYVNVVDGKTFTTLQWVFARVEVTESYSKAITVTFDGNDRVINFGKAEN